MKIGADAEDSAGLVVEEQKAVGGADEPRGNRAGGGWWKGPDELFALRKQCERRAAVVIGSFRGHQERRAEGLRGCRQSGWGHFIETREDVVFIGEGAEAGLFDGEGAAGFDDRPVVLVPADGALRDGIGPDGELGGGVGESGV